MKTLLLLLMTLAFSSAGEPLFLAFRNPAECVKIPQKAGLAYYGKSIEWKDMAGQWSSLTILKTHTGKFMKVGDVDNDVCCFFAGEQEAFIDYVSVKANCYNADGEAATMKKFREVVELLAAELKVENPKEVLKNVDRVKGKSIDTATYKFTVSKLAYNIGYGWYFKLETKK